MIEDYYRFMYKEKPSYFFIAIFPDRIAIITIDKPN
ncbi:MAG: hypothetical protein ACI87J_000512 [Colwellia sp.]|jgi:hypothetical protein